MAIRAKLKKWLLDILVEEESKTQTQQSLSQLLKEQQQLINTQKQKIKQHDALETTLNQLHTKLKHLLKKQTL